MGGITVKFNSEGLQRLRTAAQLFEIRPVDLAGPILVVLGQEHRDQEAEIFATEGADSGGGAWPPLSPEYLKRKRQAARGGRIAAKGTKGKARKSVFASTRAPISTRILVWSGDMRARFTKKGRTEYIQHYQPNGTTGGSFFFGARSEIAGYHAQIAGPSAGGHLPRRDMITKTAEQVTRMRVALVDWYRNVRIQQAKAALQQIGRAQ